MVEWFYPGFKAGGPIQSCMNLCASLNHKYDIYVLTRDRDHGEHVTYSDIVPNRWILNKELNVHVFYLGKNGNSLKKVNQVIKNLRPDILYLNLLFSPLFTLYPLLFRKLGKISAGVVVCPRGTLFPSALSVKRWKKTPTLFLMRKLNILDSVTFHATNAMEAESISRQFPGSRISIVDNLPAPIQPPFTKIIKPSGSLQCLFISRIVSIKNLYFVLEVLSTVKSKLHLTIAGPVEDEHYWKECQEKIALLPENIAVEYIGPQPPENLNSLFIHHHLFVLPSKGENFGHIILEALCAGRPVLISDQTPWINLTKYNAGWDLPLQQIDQFRDVINEISAMNQDEYDIWAEGAWNFAARYREEGVDVDKYVRLFDSVLQN